MLHVHRSASADVLVAELAALLAVPSGDPFAVEVVAVPAAGVERWLAQRLSHVLGAGAGTAGICANVRFPSPTRLLDAALGAVEDDPDSVLAWSAERVVWPLLEIVDAGFGMAAVSPGRRFGWAARLAGILTRYGHERPELLQSWARGEDAAYLLPTDLAWQPDLWRGLRARIGSPSPAERLREGVALLRKEPDRVDLPERFSIFGLNRLSTARLLVLAALAEHRDVHLWIHHASPALWDAVAANRPPTVPFLASTSRDVQALQRRLAAVATDRRDHLHPAPARPDTLLGLLQDALSSDRLPSERPVLRPDDTSVAVHACHGRARQVEVLRDVLLHRLAADPTLQPRDVLVMCPDIESFAPLLAASFGSVERGDGAAHPASALRVRLADRAPRASNPLYATLESVLELAAGRAGVGAVLDLVETDPVRRRFGLDTEQIAQLRSWVGEARISWGYDRAHRAQYGLGAIESGTWRAGLDRLLLGVAMADRGVWLADAVPLDDVDSADVDLAGRFAELVDRLHAAVEFASASHPVGVWARTLGALVNGLARPPAEWQTTALLRELDELAEDTAGYTVELGLADFIALWRARTPARPSRAGFRTGSLTVATMVPMRSVPHRVVVLLGLDDGAFPRADHPDGDDLLARDPHDGERDPRTEDRQLLLDAVCAAREALLVLHTGADERTGLTVPPAVPLAELLDALDTVACGAAGRPASAEVTVRHPLQPFDPRNFGAGASEVSAARRIVSFDPAALAGAEAVRGPRREVGRFVAAPLPPLAPGDIELDGLRSMLLAPAREFLWQRLGVRLSAADAEPPETLPVVLDPLAAWSVGERMLAARLTDLGIGDCMALETRRGVLPPLELGNVELREIGRCAEAIAVLARAELVGDAHSLDVDAFVQVGGSGRHLLGTVTGVRESTLTRVSYTRLGAKPVLAAWVDLVALTVARPDEPWRAVLIGRLGRDAGRWVLGPVAADDARAALAELVTLSDAGRCEPLPLPVKTAFAWAEAYGRGRSDTVAKKAAEREWRAKTKTGTEFGEFLEPAHVLAWGADLEFGELDVPRLGELANRLWAPVLAHLSRGGR
ncbi:MAG: exodeoxyribonuclease V subunit gamma [Sporichthyaceae bacterium]